MSNGLNGTPIGCGPEGTVSQHADIVNRLESMAGSYTSAERSDTLRKAGRTIMALERENADLRHDIERHIAIASSECPERSTETERLLHVLNPRRWTEEMNRAWHTAIPDVFLAFARLRDIATGGNEAEQMGGESTRSSSVCTCGSDCVPGPWHGTECPSYNDARGSEPHSGRGGFTDAENKSPRSGDGYYKGHRFDCGLLIEGGGMECTCGKTDEYRGGTPK